MTTIDTKAWWTRDGQRLVDARKGIRVSLRRREVWIVAAVPVGLLGSTAFTQSRDWGMAATAVAFWMMYAALLGIEAWVQRREALLARAMSRRVTDASPHSIAAALGRRGWRLMVVGWTSLSAACVYATTIVRFPWEAALLAANWLSLVVPAWYVAHRAATAPVLAVDPMSLDYDCRRRRERISGVMSGVPLALMLSVSMRTVVPPGHPSHAVLPILSIIGVLCTVGSSFDRSARR